MQCLRRYHVHQLVLSFWVSLLFCSNLKQKMDSLLSLLSIMDLFRVILSNGYTFTKILKCKYSMKNQNWVYLRNIHFELYQKCDWDHCIGTKNHVERFENKTHLCKTLSKNLFLLLFLTKNGFNDFAKMNIYNWPAARSPSLCVEPVRFAN